MALKKNKQYIASLDNNENWKVSDEKQNEADAKNGRKLKIEGNACVSKKESDNLRSPEKSCTPNTPQRSNSVRPSTSNTSNVEIQSDNQERKCVTDMKNSIAMLQKRLNNITNKTGSYKAVAGMLSELFMEIRVPAEDRKNMGMVKICIYKENGVKMVMFGDDNTAIPLSVYKKTNCYSKDASKLVKRSITKCPKSTLKSTKNERKDSTSQSETDMETENVDHGKYKPRAKTSQSEAKRKYYIEKEPKGSTSKSKGKRINKSKY